jgi:hypothetical protein
MARVIRIHEYDLKPDADVESEIARERPIIDSPNYVG